MADRVERYLFVFEAAGAAQVQAAMKAMGVSKAQLLGTEKEFTAAIRAQSRAVEQSTSRWMKHLHWIAQGILIWEGIRVIKTVIGDWLTVQKDLDTELTRFRIAMGDSNETAQEYLETVMAISREMRMPPGQIAGAVGIAYRVGEAEIAEYAAGVARLTGGDATKILRELIALHRQFPEQRMIDLMDTWVSAWQRTTLTAGEFFGLLESSGGLVKFFNTDLNVLLNLFGHITTVAGEAGGSVERFVRMFTKFYEEGHKLREVTEQFIGPTVLFDPTTGAEVRKPIEDIIQAIGELDEAQQQVIANNFPSVLGQQYGPWFLQVVKGFQVMAAEAGAFDRAMATMSRSFQDKARGMESAWDRFLSTIGDLGPFKQFMENVTWALDESERLIRERAEKPQWAAAPGLLPRFLRPTVEDFGMSGMTWEEYEQLREFYTGFAKEAPSRPIRGRPYDERYTPDVTRRPALEALPKERFQLPEGMSIRQFEIGEKLYALRMDEATGSLGRFEEALKRDITLVNEFGIPVAVTTVSVTDLGDAAAFTAEAIGELPRAFALMTTAEWELTKQLYPHYEERYKQYDIDPGETRELIGPGGDPFTVQTELWSAATREQTVITRALSQGTQELIRWQERSTAAYKKGVAAWEGMVMGLPGVTSPTAVTAYDLYALTPAGLYEDKWDEPMRQLRQNVENLIAGKPVEYPGIMAQPWIQEIFAPAYGAGPEALRGAGAMAEGMYYGFQAPWEAYEGQMPILAEEVRAFARREEQAKETKGRITTGLIEDFGLGPEAVGEFFEYEEMSPMAKWAAGGKMPDELEEELNALGGVAGKGVREGMLDEFEDNPWVDDAVGAWKTEAKTDDNIALFVGVGRIIGSNMQTGLIESIGDEIFPRVCAYIIQLINQEEF